MVVVVVVVEMTMSVSANAAWPRPERVHHPSVEDWVDKNQDGHEQEAREKRQTQDEGGKRPSGRQNVGEKRAQRRQNL